MRGRLRKGSHHTAEALAKMSAAQMGHKNSLGYEPSPETRAKISVALKGRKLSLETRAKLSAAHMGNKSSLGRKLSSETRAKISIAQRGPNYRANYRYCAKVYENAWGQIPKHDNGRAYDIHHRDGNRQNDDPENLIALTVSEHATLEHALKGGDWDSAAEVDAVGESRRSP